MNQSFFTSFLVKHGIPFLIGYLIPLLIAIKYSPYFIKTSFVMGHTNLIKLFINKSQSSYLFLVKELIKYASSKSTSQWTSYINPQKFHSLSITSLE